MKKTTSKHTVNKVVVTKTVAAALAAVIDYLEVLEKQHFNEHCAAGRRPAEHIYSKVLVVKRWAKTLSV